MEGDFSINRTFLGHYDVAVIGAGIVGSMIGRELTKFEGRFALLESESTTGFGVSKSNVSMLHSPLMFPSGPLKIKLMYNAARRYRKLAKELDVTFKETDEIFLARNAAEIARLETARNWAEENKVSAGHEIINAEKLRELEPNVSRDATGALYGKGVGGIHAPEWTFALTENAVQNGLHLYLNSKVTAISRNSSNHFSLQSGRGFLTARYIINAAGLHADEIAWMAGDEDIRLTLDKGTMAILDKSASHLVRNMTYGTFTKDKSQVVTPTAHGNLLIGVGTFEKAEHKRDTAVSRERLREIIDLAKEIFPPISEKHVITSFVGIRSQNNKAAQGDFYISRSEHTPGLLHAIVGSPGLTAAPAIAEMIAGLLVEEGLRLEERKTFQRTRIGWPRFSEASSSMKKEMIAANPKYGHIVCRCEQVTEAEIVQAIRRGATTVDAVKHLTRAGMGRCQSGFCGTSVMKLLSKELGISARQVTKMGEGSCLITGYAKG